MTKIMLTVELDSAHAEDAKLLIAITQAMASRTKTNVHPSGGIALPSAAQDDPQITKAEDIASFQNQIQEVVVEGIKVVVETAEKLTPKEHEKVAEAVATAKAPVTATIPKAVMPIVPKAVMPAAMQAAPTPAAPAPIPAEADVPAAAPSVTIKDLRDLMAIKITKHVDVLRTKLAEYGTANISSMKPEYYEEFYAYLKSLED